MWSILNGTIVNTITVALGSTVGLCLAARVPERFQRIVLTCLGLVTIMLGIDASVLVLSDTVRRYGEGIPTYGARLAMVVVSCLLVGAILGTLLRIHERIEGLGSLIHRRFGGASVEAGTLGDAPRFAEGFLSASVIFCVGPLTLLGCLKNGIDANPDYLYIKALLDGFCSAALAATLGIGVLFSVLTVLIFQGSLAILAHYAAAGLSDVSLQLMNVVGGIVLLATALVLLDIKKIPVADLLPGIFLPPLAVWLVESLQPGLLIPLAN